MKSSIRLSSTGSQTSQGAGLTWDADTLIVVNPTAKTLCVRLGSQSIPTGTTDADIFIPPATMQALPVYGREFGFAFTLPQLASQPSGMPTSAQIILQVGETVPAFGAVALSTTSVNIVNPTETVLYTGTYVTSGTDTQNLAVGSDIAYLEFQVNSLTTGDSVQILGSQSGFVYLEYTLAYNGGTFPRYLRVKFDPSLDTSIRLRVIHTSVFGADCRLVGQTAQIGWGAQGLDGRARVDVLPAGNIGLPIIPYVGSTAASASNPLPAQLSLGNAAVSTTNPLPTRRRGRGVITLVAVANVNPGAGNVTYGTFGQLGGAGWRSGYFYFYARTVGGGVTLTPALWTPDGNFGWSNFNACTLSGQVASMRTYPGCPVAAGNPAASNYELMDNMPVVVNHSAGGVCSYELYFHPAD